MCRVIAVSNQKGGVGKTVSCVNLGIGLAQSGKKVLLIDADPQGSMTISLGYPEPDDMEYSLASMMMNIVNDEPLNMDKTILHHKEGVDLIPANIELSAIEVSLVNVMSRELILRTMVDQLRQFYDFIIIDCMPSLGMMTINALACADSVLIPVQAAYLPVKGLQQLIKTISRVKKQLNPKLKIEGILLTMVDNRTNYARDISLMVYDTYSANIKVFAISMILQHFIKVFRIIYGLFTSVAVSLLGSAFIGCNSEVNLYKAMAICFGVTAVWTIISWKCIINK